MVCCLQTAVQRVPALREPFPSQSVSVGPICCTSEPCDERSAAGERCSDLNNLRGREKAEVEEGE